MGLKLRMLVENQLSEEYFSGINICDERDTHSRGLDGVCLRTNLPHFFIYYWRFHTHFKSVKGEFPFTFLIKYR